MNVAIASGKGGTGKTTIATNLAFLASADGGAVAYVDCDVEEPNGHLFLHPEVRRQEPILQLVPVVDDDRCVHCGRCSQACRYGAIACVPQRTIVFVELCHACGGCLLACPAEAIREVPRSIGWLRYGTCGSLEFVEGELHVGEAMSPPAIRAVKRTALDAELTLWDCPPGTSCAVIESVRGCDLLVLVTEPTPFGLHDLKLAVDMARSLQLPLGVVVNRADAGERELWGYCAREGLPILAEIPDDRAVAEAYARGILAAQAVPQVAHRLRRLLDTIASGATA